MISSENKVANIARVANTDIQMIARKGKRTLFFLVQTTVDGRINVYRWVPKGVAPTSYHTLVQCPQCWVATFWTDYDSLEPKLQPTSDCFNRDAMLDEMSKRIIRWVEDIYDWNF